MEQEGGGMNPIEPKAQPWKRWVVYLALVFIVLIASLILPQMLVEIETKSEELPIFNKKGNMILYGCTAHFGGTVNVSGTLTADTIYYKELIKEGE